MNVVVENTFSTPALNFSGERLSLEGKAISIDISDFFKPIFLKINYLIAHKGPNINVVEFNISYANSSAKRNIIELLKKIAKLNRITNNRSQIIWKSHLGDDFMEELGKDISSIIGVPFIFEGYC